MSSPSELDEFSAFHEMLRNAPELPSRRRGSSPAERARRRLRILISSVVITVLLIASGGYLSWVSLAAAPLPTVPLSYTGVPVQAKASIVLSPEGFSGVSVSGAQGSPGAAAFGSWTNGDSDKPRSMASISKLIAALVVLDAKPLKDADDPGPTIVFTQADRDLFSYYYQLGAEQLPMPAGTALSERDTLAAMLIPSAANYAAALVLWAFGSQDAYVAAAHQWLKAHNLTHTTVVEATGISAENTSIPSDLLEIGRLAAANPALVKITSTTSMTLPGLGTFSNTNDLLGTDGITGLKTGNLGTGTYNLLYTSTLDVGLSQPLTVTGVVLGGQNRASVDHDVLTTLASIRAGFHRVAVVASGQNLGDYVTAWGIRVPISVTNDETLMLWSDTPVTVSSSLTPPTTQLTEGGVVGTLTWKAGQSTVSTPLSVADPVSPPSLWWRFTHPFELSWP